MAPTAVSSFLQPLFIALAVEAGIDHNTDRVWLYMSIMFGLAGVQWISSYVQQLATAWMGNRLLLKLRTQMYDHMQGLSLSFYDEMEVGRMISRLTSDVTVMQELLTSGSLTFLADIIGLCVVIVILFTLDPVLATVTLAVVPPLVLVMVWWARHARQAFVNVRVKISALYGTLAENVSGVRAVQSMSREGENARRFDALNQDNLRANVWA
ncbi:MAG TPA: ABC transporter transmembrane domain-containing protein, partial [Tepidiformaceae bacterium]|nr:ABC transporter transmembrane domain-containing protein [Tepidiformaceae bacterium]